MSVMVVDDVEDINFAKVLALSGPRESDSLRIGLAIGVSLRF